MSFTQAPVNYAAQYSRELANAYPYLSYFGDIWNAGESARFKPLRGKTVYIPSMTVKGAVAANRDQITGTFNRNFNLEWEAKDLAMDREWETLIDPLDMVETDEVATIAAVTKTFNETQKIPEQDAYMASKLAGFAGQFGGIDTTSLTSSNILDQWDAALEYMVDQRVNRDRIRCKMTPSTYKKLKEAAGITRFVDVANGIRGIDRNVAKLDGVSIEEVPADMMKTVYTFTEGWAVDTTNAKQINMLLVDPMALAAPIVYDQAIIGAPSAQSKGKYLYYERYYYDVFCLNQRGAGFFANVGSAPSLGELTVTCKAGSAAGDALVGYTGALIGQNGNPVSGYDVYITSGQSAAVSLTYNGALPSTETWTKISGKNPAKLASQTANKYATVAVVNNETSKVVAGGNVVLVVGT